MRITSLIDVDNTLIDNDAAKVEIDQRLHALLGDQGTADFWAAYEEVRAECGVVDIPRAMARALGPGTPLERRIALAALFMEFPFRDYIVPGAAETVAFLQTRGPVAILSDGDPVFQATKVTRAGLADLVGGHMPDLRPQGRAPARDRRRLPGRPLPADRRQADGDRALHGPPGGARRPLETIFVRQGKYAAAVPPALGPAPPTPSLP